MEDNFASSHICEDVVIFTSRRLNAYNAKVGRGTTIIIGGSREILQDILEYRLALAQPPKSPAGVEVQSTNRKRGTPSPRPRQLSASTSATAADDFGLIVEDDGEVVKLTQVIAFSTLPSQH